LFSKSDYPSQQPAESQQQVNNASLLLIAITLSVVAASWLFSLPSQFNLKFLTELLPLLFAVPAMILVRRLQNPLVNQAYSALAYVIVFSSWSYVVYINTAMQLPAQKSAILHIGFANSMYLLGMCVLTIWLARYFRYALYLSATALLALSVVLILFTSVSFSFVVAVAMILLTGIAIGFISNTEKTTSETTSDVYAQEEFNEEDLLPPAENEQQITPELEINALPLNESSVSHDWDEILQELHGELKSTSDVDQLFKRMLMFLNGAMEFDAAAVGMLQDKSIRKIATFGGDEFLHTQSLNWSNQRINDLFSSRKPILSRQSHMSRQAGVESEPLHRLDIPVISNGKVVGVVTLFREHLLFDTNDIKLASSIVFHSMIALRQARLQDEVKRLSSSTPVARLTVYSREQFVEQVKPVIEKLDKPRECSLFIVEIDNLDQVIDKVGREAGQQLYKAVSRAIATNLKESDLIGQYGKEAFVVLLDETELMDAKNTAENIRAQVENIKLKYQGQVITTTVSIGLTIFSDADENLPSLMRKADMGLFVAKENGSNTVKVSL
jgi:diguanylate cyclase (GGDEF)-like protein